MTAPAIVFIGGYTRSGSTLLDRLLGAAPGAVAVSELRHVWGMGVVEDRFCGCGTAFGRCRWWQDVLREGFGGVSIEQARGWRAEEEALYPARHLAGLRFPALLPARLRRYRARFLERRSRLLQAIADVSGCTVVVDSSKNPSYGLLLAQLPDVDVRTVHLVRDSRATSFSWTREKVDPRHEGQVDHFPRRRPHIAATWWLANALLMEVSALLLRRRHTRLRYEDLVADPAGALSRLADLLALPAPAAAAGREATFELPAQHSIGGNPVRFEQGAVRVREDDEWKRALSARDRRAVTAITWPLLLRHGYSLFGGRP